MDYTITNKDDSQECQLKVTGTIPEHQVEQLRNDALVEFMRNSGIEKGTPEDTWKILVDGLGEEEASDMLGKYAIGKVTPLIITNEGLETMFIPEPNALGNIMDDKDFDFEVTFIIKPHMELSSYDAVEVFVAHEQVTDTGVTAEINDQLENIANKQGEGSTSIALTDAVVKEHFGAWAQTADEFRDVVRVRLQEMKEAAYKQRVSDAVLDKLSKRLEGEVPEILNIKSQEEVLANMQAQLDAHNTTLEEYMKQGNMDEREFDMVIALDGANAVRQQLTLDAIARHLGLSVTEQDRTATLAQIAPGVEDEARADLDATNTWYVIDELTKQNKALDWAVENATIEER